MTKVPKFHLNNQNPPQKFQLEQEENSYKIGRFGEPEEDGKEVAIHVSSFSSRMLQNPDVDRRDSSQINRKTFPFSTHLLQKANIFCSFSHGLKSKNSLSEQREEE